MSNSKKFNVKTLLLCILAFVVVVLFIYFLFFKKENYKVLNCTMKIDSVSFANIDISIDAYYSKYVDKLKGTINYEITDDKLKSQASVLKDRISESYKNIFTGDSTDFSVDLNGSTIVLNYAIDYTKYKDGDINSFDLFDVGSINDKISIEDFKNSIKNSGGTCVEG